MGLLDPYIAQYHADVKPVLMRGADRAERYAATICDRLGHIHRELATDRDPGEVMAVNVLLPADASTVRVFTVPAGEEWVLEACTTDTAAAVFMRLTQDGNFRIATSNAVRTEPLRFVGMCEIAAGLSAAGTAAPAYIQLRRLARRARPTFSGGLIETGLDAVDALREHDPLHSGIGIG